MFGTSFWITTPENVPVNLANVLALVPYEMTPGVWVVKTDPGEYIIDWFGGHTAAEVVNQWKAYLRAYDIQMNSSTIELSTLR